MKPDPMILSIDELVRYAPKLFPGLTQMVEACWGWQTYDNTAELHDLVTTPTSALAEVGAITSWLSTRRKSTAPLDIMKLGLEVDWILNHLIDADVERLLCRLGLVTPIVPSSDFVGEPYRRLVDEIRLGVSTWLDNAELEVPQLAVGSWPEPRRSKAA